MTVLQAVSELYGKRKWLGQAAGEACLQVTSAAFGGDGEFTDVALPLLAPLLRGKDGSVLEVSEGQNKRRERGAGGKRGEKVGLTDCLMYMT